MVFYDFMGSTSGLISLNSHIFIQARPFPNGMVV